MVSLEMSSCRCSLCIGNNTASSGVLGLTPELCLYTQWGSKTSTMPTAVCPSSPTCTAKKKISPCLPGQPREVSILGRVLTPVADYRLAPATDVDDDFRSCLPVANLSALSTGATRLTRRGVLYLTPTYRFWDTYLDTGLKTTAVGSSGTSICEKGDSLGWVQYSKTPLRRADQRGVWSDPTGPQCRILLDRGYTESDES